ncbi:MAG TPA: DOMON-like domain-containing protein [Caulobacteraceae bacterium]|jgi:hypothetical protein
MRRALLAHPATPPAAEIRIAAALARAEGGLTLAFVVTGEVGRLRIAGPAAPERADGLWRTTCFEAFLQAREGGPYVELNLSPSGAWAAYRFSTPREEMTAAALAGPPRIETELAEDRFELRAEVGISEPLPAQTPWRVGLSAVIEETGGRKSYFALAHPSGKPDFHDSRGFVLEV